MQPLAAAPAAPAGGRATRKRARLAAILAGIDAYLPEPGLSAATLGARLGLSERYVHHLLAGAGLKFTRLVREKRLARARLLLEEAGAPRRRIVDIAYAVGFGDLSHFNRAFRRQFGLTPSAVRCRM